MTKTTIYQDLEQARTFADTMRIRERIMNETSGYEQRGYLISLDCLEKVLDEMAQANEHELELQQGRDDLNNPNYHNGF